MKLLIADDNAEVVVSFAAQGKSICQPKLAVASNAGGITLSSTQFLDLDATNSPQRFYRLR